MVSGHILDIQWQWQWCVDGGGISVGYKVTHWAGLGGTYLPADDICLNNVNSKQTHSPILIVVSAL